ncbi:MAG: ParB/RepB/Spo0J family partition protein [Candidatus Dormibacteria bacterium]
MVGEPADDDSAQAPATPPNRLARNSGFHAELAYLERDDIQGSPIAQPRDPHHVHQDLQDLVSSIETHGLLDPIKVHWDEDASKYRVIDGHRRLAAIDQIALTNPAVHHEIKSVAIHADHLNVVTGLKPTDRWLVLAMALNAQRKDLTGAEKGRVYLQLRAQLGTMEAVAKVCGVTTRTIYRALQYAADANRKLEEKNPAPSLPAWAQKRWITSAQGLLRSGARLETDQREATSRWLHSVARAVQRGQTVLPPFVYQEDGTAPAGKDAEPGETIPQGPSPEID